MHEEVVTFLNRASLGCEAKVVEPQEVGDKAVSVFPDYLLNVCRELKNSRWEFRTLEVISGIDWGDSIEINYMLTSFTKQKDLILKITLPKKGETLPSVDSVGSVWASANWQERECYDMIGVNFKGHPDPRRILCPYDWTGHPLRKDYIPQEKYHGMEVDPKDKINTEDHLFCANLKKTAPDPAKVSGSWKSDDKTDDVV